jgi:hypothetical protein
MIKKKAKHWLGILLIGASCASFVYSQKPMEEPISRDQLFKSLEKRLTKGGLEHLINRVKEWKVSFQINETDDQSIRKLQNHLAKEQVDALILAIRQNYHVGSLPSVAFLYRDKQIQINNLTKSELYIWGTKLDDGPLVMNKDSVVLSPQPFFYFIEGYEELALKQIPEGGEARPIYYVFVKDKQEQKFTLKCLLWSTVNDHRLTVRTQNLGVENGWLGMTTKKEEEQAKPDLPVANVRWVTEPVSSPREEYPYALRVTIQSTAPISPVHFVVACSGPIGPADVQGLPSGVSFGVEVTVKNSLYELRIQAPPLTPQQPLIFVIVSKERVKVLRVDRVVE